MADAADMLRRSAKDIQKFHGDQLKKHGNALRKQLIASAKSATGGDRSLSGLGPDGPKLGVTLRTVRGLRTTTVTIKPSPKAALGPWVWIDSGTRSGVRGRKGWRKRRDPTKSYVTRQREPYLHPGTKGSNAWFGPVDEELPKIQTDLRRQFDAISR